MLVMPFENLKREARIFWLGEASAVLLADDLNALGANAITRQERRQAFERLQVPPAASLTDATVIRIGQIVGAAEAIVGSFQVDDEVLIVAGAQHRARNGPGARGCDRARAGCPSCSRLSSASPGGWRRRRRSPRPTSTAPSLPWPRSRTTSRGSWLTRRTPPSTT